jgi:outer membrane lipoprotein SlyB
MKEQVSKITGNPIGAIAGGVAVFFAAKKFGKVENKWALGALAIVGVVAGAMIQGKMKAKAGVPTAQTVTAKK